MPDREKVLKGLECCSLMNGHACSKCPYSFECVAFETEYQTGTAHLAADALALLKEQETTNTGYERIFGCEKCGYGIVDIFINSESKYDILPKYCPNCGRKVKRNDR